MLRALRAQIVVADAANKGANEVSGGADSWIRAGCGVHERLQRGIRPEALGKVLCGLGIETVAREAAKGGEIGMSAGADTFAVWSSSGTHFSDFVAVFELIRLAMTTAEASRSPLDERSIDSTGSSPLNFFISRGWPSRL